MIIVIIIVNDNNRFDPFQRKIFIVGMGGIEEIPEDSGPCPPCGKIATTKCTGCKNVYYCNRTCQKKDWKTHKPSCKMLPYKVGIIQNISSIDFVKNRL